MANSTTTPTPDHTPKYTSAQLADMLKAAKAAEKAAKTHTTGTPKSLKHFALDNSAKNPEVTIRFALFEEPSVDNGYGKLIVASSKQGFREYVAVGAIAGMPEFEGCIVEVTYKARITPKA